MTTSFVLDALNQALCQRCAAEGCGLIHHSDRGSQYLSFRYTERLADAGIDTSVGTVGDTETPLTGRAARIAGRHGSRAR